MREPLLSGIFLHIQLYFCTEYLQRNYNIAQAVLNLRIKLIQVFSYFTEQTILDTNASIYCIYNHKYNWLLYSHSALTATVLLDKELWFSEIYDLRKQRI